MHYATHPAHSLCEPRAYSNAPIGMNFLIAGYAYTQGGLAFDASLPVKDPDLKTSSAVLAYVRTLDLWGKSGKFDAVVHYTWLSGTAYLYGAPALTLKEFADYRQDLIVGLSLQVSVPIGQYDPSKLVNIGTNRWSFKPEVGVSKAVGPWTLEVSVAATRYTDNTDFFGGKTRSQNPVYSMRGHVIYGFPSGIWASLDAAYLTGGRSTLNGVQSNDLQQNWRVGGTLAFPVDVRNSIKLYASSACPHAPETISTSLDLPGSTGGAAGFDRRRSIGQIERELPPAPGARVHLTVGALGQGPIDIGRVVVPNTRA